MELGRLPFPALSGRFVGKGQDATRRRLFRMGPSVPSREPPPGSAGHPLPLGGSEVFRLIYFLLCKQRENLRERFRGLRRAFVGRQF